MRGNIALKKSLVFAMLLGVAKAFSQEAAAVSIINNKAKGVLEIRNGLLGIVVPAEGVYKNQQFIPAPIQSFIYNDGVYSDNSPNALRTGSKLSSLTVKIIQATKRRVVVQVAYKFIDRVFVEKKNTQPPLVKGYYTCTITLEQGSKSILIEDESNCDLGFRVKISDGLKPDQARYRGWASYTSKEGREPDGRIYRDEDSRGYPLDAIVDINYNENRKYPRLILWEPAGGEINSGRYWQVYNSRTGRNGNLFGFFQGQPSKLIMAGGLGPALHISPEEPTTGERQTAEINIDINQLWPLDSWPSRKRYQWGVFISTKRDLLSPEETQPIGIEMNRVSGLGAIVREYFDKPVKIVPAFYKGAIYMHEKEVSELRKRIKQDVNFYQYICSIESFYKPIWDAWHNRDSARSLIKQLLLLPDELIKQHVYKDGSYTTKYRYWKGARMFKFYAICISSLFSDESIEIQAKDKIVLEKLIGLMARIVNNYNFVPIFDSAGVNMGPANMAFQYRNNARLFFTLLLANDPEYKKAAANVEKTIDNDIKNVFYGNGSSFGSPHYTQAAIDPILFTILQMRQAGMSGYKKWNSSLISFSNFFCNFLTPKSVRFSYNRKLISFGDGSEESAATFGLLHSLLRSDDRKLGDQLLAFYHNGPPRSSFAGPIMLAVDLTRQASNSPKANLANCNYKGYLSHFRAGVNSDFESASWILNGDKFFDHRNDDAGEIAIYALGAPLSLSRSSFYYPSATDARIRSVVVPEKMFPEWNGPSQPISGRSLTNRTWPTSNQTEYANLGGFSVTEVKMQTPQGPTWYRKFGVLDFFEQMPIFLLYDSVRGSESNIWSMLMMSEGVVNTPSGNITPERRIHNFRDLQQLPSATPEKTLTKGWNKFGFNGQIWKKHPSGGINWDLYTNLSGDARFTLSQWGTTWQTNVEADEFKITNGRNYTEEQQILRLRFDRPVFTVLVPFLKTSTNKQSFDIRTPNSDELLIRRDDYQLKISPSCIIVTGSKEKILYLVDGSRVVISENIRAEGGIMCITQSKDNLIVRIHGNSGVRRIEITGTPVIPKQSYRNVLLRRSASKTLIEIDYKQNGDDLKPGMSGYTEFVFSQK